MSEMNYDQVSNGQVCTCGKHHGVGSWSPHDRAKRYARMKAKLPAYFAPHMQQYLASWICEHGNVDWSGG